MADGSGRHYQIKIITILVSDRRYDEPEPSRLTRLLLISPILLLDGVVSHQSPQASGVLGLQFAPLFEVSSIPGVHLLARLGHLHTKYNNNAPHSQKRPSHLFKDRFIFVPQFSSPTHSIGRMVSGL